MRFVNNDGKELLNLPIVEEGEVISGGQEKAIQFFNLDDEGSVRMYGTKEELKNLKDKLERLLRQFNK